MSSRTGRWTGGCTLLLLLLVLPSSHADGPAAPAEVESAVERLTAARAAKDARAAAEAIAPVAELLERVQDSALRGRLVAALGAILRTPEISGAHRAAIDELLAINDSSAAYQQLRDHMPQPKHTDLNSLGAKVLAALSEHPLDAALRQVRELAASARAPETRAAALKTLAGYGKSPARVSVLEFLLQELVRGNPVPDSMPRWTWVVEWQQRSPLLLAALQRLTGRQDRDLGSWAAAYEQNRSGLAALFDRDAPLPVPPQRKGTPWRRMRAKLGSAPGPVRSAVERALRWLSAHQSPDGAFRAAEFAQWCDGAAAQGKGPTGPGNPAYDVGLTGLALNAFLVAGYGGSGDHPYEKAVARGLAWLASTQDADGAFGPRDVRGRPQVEWFVVVQAPRQPTGPGGLAPVPDLSGAGRKGLTKGEGVHVYNQALATLALVEAYGLTGDPELRRRAQRGLDWIHAARNPYFGWRYGKKPGDNDTSVTVWMTLVLCCAKLVNAAHLQEYGAAPFAVDEEAFDGVKAWFYKMLDADYGRVGYVQRGTSSSRPDDGWDRFPNEKSEALTAGAMCIRMLMGEEPRTSDAIWKGSDLVAKWLPTWNEEDGSIDMIHWHFGTLALQRIGGKGWDVWAKALHATLLDHQHKNGDACGELGSWDPVDPWGVEGGRVYATAINALTLLSPWRFPAWAR